MPRLFALCANRHSPAGWSRALLSKAPKLVWRQQARADPVQITFPSRHSISAAQEHLQAHIFAPELIRDQQAALGLLAATFNERNRRERK